jgi:hypothetical protein
MVIVLLPSSSSSLGSSASFSNQVQQYDPSFSSNACHSFVLTGICITAGIHAASTLMSSRHIEVLYYIFHDRLHRNRDIIDLGWLLPLCIAAHVD